MSDIVKADGSLADPYRNFIHVSRYSRWIDQDSRRETWVETVDRYIEFFRARLSDRYGYADHDLLLEVREAIINHEIMPSMRALMTAGVALDRSNIAAYNCSFIAVNDPASFSEGLFILLNGTGVGFSVEKSHVEKLPPVPNELVVEPEAVIIVGDSKEGWTEAFRSLLDHLWSGAIPSWDTSNVRPAGSRLKTFGGRASGPAPLEALLKFTVETFQAAKGRRLTPVECHDLMCKIGDIVVVGGVRRSAMISLSDLGDHDMAKAKSGNWWENSGHRALANNSATYLQKPSVTQFLREWRNLIESQSGERGIFNLDGARQHADSQGRDGSQLMGTNPCLTGDTVIATIDGPRTFADLAESGNDVLVYSWDAKTKTPVVRWMRRPHKTRENAEILKVTFDSGLVVRATPDHAFYSFRGKKVKAKDLRAGQSVRAFSASRDSSGHERVHGWDSNRNGANHQWTHRMIWENENGPIQPEYVVAHLDNDATNNSLDNLALMSDLAHRQYDMRFRVPAGFDGHSPNHRVVSVDAGGYADVYNGMVEGSHSYIVLDATPVAGHMSGIVSANCGEILLRDQEFCNLTEVIIGPVDTMDVILRKVRLATILGTWQSTLTDFPLLRQAWQDNCEEERLLGVSLTGIYGNPAFNDPNDAGLPARLQATRNYAHKVNAQMASALGIKKAAAITTVKPSGTVSQLTGVSSGIHPWHSQFYIRSVRGSNNDPLTQMLRDYGIPNEPDVMKPADTTVFYFPVKAPNGAVVSADVTALDHLKLWSVYRTNWTDHNPSVTVSVGETEWLGVADWVYSNWDSVGGVSFLPRENHTYQQAPYQECTEAEYEAMLAKMPDSIRWADLALYEMMDSTTSGQTLACGVGGCDTADFGTVEPAAAI